MNVIQPVNCLGVFRRLPSLAVVALLCAFTFASGAAAQAVECTAGQGQACANDNTCAGNREATLCVGPVGVVDSATCQVPCDDRRGDVDSAQCAMGETCVIGSLPSGGKQAHFCKAAPFSMDLNLLDQCLYHFLEGVVPVTSGDSCSLQASLNALLDSPESDTIPADGVFNIDDVDRCITAFLRPEICDPVSASCANGDVYCDTNNDCGSGSYCEGGVHRCERQCGAIATRDGSGISVVDRECSGALKACDVERGKCYTPAALGSCLVDDDCLNASYCLVGQCTPNCYRAIDCPDSTWMCSTTSRCEPAPLDPTVSAGFDPLSYALSFAIRDIKLDLIKDSYDIPLLIMNLATRAQVLDDPAVVFGYRLEVVNYRKLEDRCMGDLGLLKPEQRDDCIISPDEEFITLQTPFGTVYGQGNPVVRVRLNHAAADILSTGEYQATIRAIFNNGSTTTGTVRFRKPSPNGDYYGSVQIYKNSKSNLLGNTNLAMRLFVDKAAPQVEWDSLLQENHLPRGNEFIDLTRGYRVTGYIDGSAGMAFAWPDAYDVADNRIPVRGIYSTDSGRMRLISAIDLPAEHCRSESASGRCTASNGSSLQVSNSFQRDVRRILHFLGDFDALRNEFSGMYREDITGMFPSVLTLDGEFSLRQTVQRDEAPITPAHIRWPTIPEHWSPVVGFPSVPAITAELNRDIDQYCSTALLSSGPNQGSSVDTHFANRAAFDAYLAGFHSDDEGPVLQQLITFEDRIQTAIDTLGSDSGAALTLADYFKGQILFCSDDVTTECVDQAKLSCGLALHRKALVSGWVPAGALGSERSETLFCRIRAGAGDDCPIGASALQTQAERAVVGLQEHNRFYKELVQTYSYEAAGAISDAFFTMYKASNGDALDANSAFVHKDLNLRKALSAYEEVQRTIMSPASARVMAAWPMHAFATRGRSWIDHMQTVMGDRLDGMLALLDLRRRIIGNNGAKVEMFTRHVMHQEYLHQVYLMELQSRWEGAQFAYQGEGPRAMAEGALLLAKVKASRNPMGLHPNRIYFENSNRSTSNWQNFRDDVAQQIPLLRQTVASAIQEMKGALRDKDSLENNLLSSQQDIEAQLDQMCGQDSEIPAVCSEGLEYKRELVTSCVEGSCDFKFRCLGTNSSCEVVQGYFDDHASVACRTDAQTLGLRVPVQGGMRFCSNGEMGSLLQEQARLNDERRRILNQVQGLVRRVAREESYIAQVEVGNRDLADYIDNVGLGIIGIDTALFVAETTAAALRSNAKAIHCNPPIAGTSVSLGSCIGALIAGSSITGLELALLVAKKAASIATSEIYKAQEVYLSEHANDRQVQRMRLDLSNMVTEAESLVYAYETVIKQEQNIRTRIVDTGWRAERMANRHAEQIENIVDHLLGRESGSVLVRNRLVQEADKAFRELLTEVYKMAQAFSYRYNLGVLGDALQNEVFSIQTVEEIALFVERLNDLESGYCGLEGLDCDTANNWEVFEFSVQKQLFPSLRPLMNADDGTVVRTVGQQFHDLITSSRYLKRVSRASGVRSQIELPVGIFLQDRSGAGNAPQRYMVNPDECNHFLVAGRSGNRGNVAVNVVGTRLRSDKNITYELQRGAIDFVRDCHERTDKGEAELNKYMVGWSPENAFGRADLPPSFLTSSSGFTACENASGLGQPIVPGNLEGCFRYFARDRSLASNDWKLIIPQMDDEQAWLIDPDTPEHERPIIEDVVLYFRYNARPITDF